MEHDGKYFGWEDHRHHQAFVSQTDLHDHPTPGSRDWPPYRLFRCRTPLPMGPTCCTRLKGTTWSRWLRTSAIRVDSSPFHSTLIRFLRQRSPAKASIFPRDCCGSNHVKERRFLS